MRFVDSDYNVHERANGCYHMKKSDAESLSHEIIKIISKNKLDINKCIAQCYDGAKDKCDEWIIFWCPKKNSGDCTPFFLCSLLCTSFKSLSHTHS